MYFDETNNYFDDYKNININLDRVDKLYSYEEGFNKGNLFKNLYSKYKNHVYKLSVNNNKDKLLLNIQMHTFALKDLNLYLDTHPNDENILKEFNNVNDSLTKLKKEYEDNYGPLCINSVKSDKNYTWINNPWPWDDGRK